MARHSVTYSSREAAAKQAEKLRDTFVSVVVFPIGGKFGDKNHKGRWGIAYDDKHRRTEKQREARARRK
ncbi:hypothetical protein V3W47_18990 [Deinococcus sp. YIM 134068]|uniref:hypothetical protein n=1 Tax=Deinococcus lichenicola TaxID=3118910 RepID=UPI002F953EC0